MGGAIDLDDPANRRLIEVFGRDAASWREGQPRDDELEGWHLRTHPDVVERVEALGRSVAGVRFAGLLGRPCLAAGQGVIVAVGEGTSTLDLRLGAAAPADAIAAHPFAPRPDLGSDWLAVSIWLSEVPTAVGLRALAGWIAAAAARLEG